MYPKGTEPSTDVRQISVWPITDSEAPSEALTLATCRSTRRNGGYKEIGPGSTFSTRAIVNCANVISGCTAYKVWPRCLVDHTNAMSPELTQLSGQHYLKSLRNQPENLGSRCDGMGALIGGNDAYDSRHER